MIPLVRSLLATWVILWSTSRQDVTLHLVSWVILGSALAGFTRNTWLARFPFIVDFAEDASSELLDILPDSKTLVSLLSFAICGMAALFLAGAEHKTRGGSMRGAWIFFALSRHLFPVSFCGVDYRTDPIETALVVLFTVLSFVGPLASWPSRVFAISDMVYALVVQRLGSGDVCSGTEAAVVAAGLALAHDLVHLRFLHFLESAAYSIAGVFILETTVMVTLLHQSAREETWSDAFNLFQSYHDLEAYLFTKAPPVLLFAWAVGMFLRTFTQGRTTVVELAISAVVGLVFGGFVLMNSRDPQRLATKPSFACTTAVVAMGVASRFASARKRILKNNQYILASGFFPREYLTSVENNANGVDLFSDRSDLEPNESTYLPTGVNINYTTTSQIPLPSVLTKEGSARALTTASGDDSAAETKRNEIENVYFEYETKVQRMKSLQKSLFYHEALLKGHPTQQEKDEAKSEINKLKAEFDQTGQEVNVLQQQLQEHEKTMSN